MVITQVLSKSDEGKPLALFQNFENLKTKKTIKAHIIN